MGADGIHARRHTHTGGEGPCICGERNWYVDLSVSFVFTLTKIGFVARELLTALAYLHKNKIVHRCVSRLPHPFTRISNSRHPVSHSHPIKTSDLKSGNIMMTIKGQIKLIDFGLCVDMSGTRQPPPPHD